MNVIAIIAARGGSKRLPRKNIYPVLGIPMLGWVVRACQDSKHISQVYVSTEDQEIKEVANQWGASVIDRPLELADDIVLKHEAVMHAVKGLMGQGIAIDVVLSVQPNSPELTGTDLDAGIDKFLAHDRWEIFSVGTDLLQNGAFRVMRRDVVFSKTLSMYCGVIVADCVDVHTLEDVEEAEARLKRRGLPVPCLSIPDVDSAKR